MTANLLVVELPSALITRTMYMPLAYWVTSRLIVVPFAPLILFAVRTCPEIFINSMLVAFSVDSKDTFTVVVAGLGKKLISFTAVVRTI